MKAQKKRVGTKAKIRAEKEKERRIATTIFLAFILSMVILSAYFAYTHLNPASDQSFIEPALQFKPENPNPKLKAAIVDQLSLTMPNKTFMETAADTLNQAGYTVDYYAGEEVTVESFGELPTHGYGLIVLRMHSSAAELQGKGLVECPVTFFTSESYSGTKYVYEQATDQLLGASYTGGRPPYYFSIAPKFVTSSMKGTFQNTIVIMMGCEGLSNTKMAEVFVEKGAKAYVGWNGSVSSSHTDQAATQLLKHLVTEGQTISQAVENTAREVGPDEAYDSILKYYPLASGNYAIQG